MNEAAVQKIVEEHLIQKIVEEHNDLEVANALVSILDKMKKEELACLNAENARVKAENARVKAENARVKAENAELVSENQGYKDYLSRIMMKRENRKKKEANQMQIENA